MTRTISLGPPRDPRVEVVHAIVLEAQLRAERDLRPGMTGREGDALARQAIERAGYGQAFTHILGHGVGLEVHEPPWVSLSRGDEELRPGMVFSVEPGIYLPGWGGVRIEDLVVLEQAGARVLCHSPRDLVRNSRSSTEHSVLAGGSRT
jgi:Xaa-Pro aminopeptidase